MKYTFECSQGHEPMTMTVEAENDDEAMEQMMGQAKAHLGEHHPDMANMSDDEVKNMIMQGWKKE